MAVTPWNGNADAPLPDLAILRLHDWCLLQDMVPRMSLWTIERLRDEMMICALRCKVSCMEQLASRPCACSHQEASLPSGGLYPAAIWLAVPTLELQLCPATPCWLVMIRKPKS